MISRSSKSFLTNLPKEINKMENENQKTDVIYILLSQSKKLFMILCGCKDSIRETYRHHLKGRRLTTEWFVTSLLPERPCIFILEEIDPDEEANLLVVWLKILLDQGYVSCNHPDIIEQAEHLYMDNTLAYSKRKSTNLSSILACENCLIPVYNKKPCPQFPVAEEGSSHSSNELLQCNCQKKRSVEIRFAVTEAENELIIANARRLGMQRNIYIKCAAKHPVIHQHNYEVIDNHTRELAEIRKTIYRLVFTIEATNNYVPREIETVVNAMNFVMQTENELLKAMREQREILRKTNKSGT